jgi:RNA polymerase sigma factor (sigma-70 family)
MDKIIKDNAGLIFAQLKRLNIMHDPEAQSIGYEALWNAAMTYNESKGYKFSTYATCCIYNALCSYIRTLNKKRQLEVVSYNSIAYQEDGTKHEYLELLSTGIVDTEQELLQKELYCTLNRAIQISYDRLTNPKHKAVIKVWRDAEYNISNKEVATAVGVSQPYVNQIINTFKNSIKKIMEGYFNE